MIEKLPSGSPKIIGFRLHGKLHDEDYKSFTPTVDAAVAAEGKINILAHFDTDFHGWDMHAMWDDLRFGMMHYKDFERIAMVGDRPWEKWLTMLYKPFTRAEVRYFDKAELDEAWKWVEERSMTQAA